jgi:hypothetical protein
MGNPPEYDRVDDGIDEAAPEPADSRYRWIGAPDWDQSPGADFRRQVADLLREVEEKARLGAAGGSGGPGEGEREPEPAESYEIRAGTPYLLARLMTLLSARLGPAPPRADRWRGADEALLQWLTPAERDELRRLLRKGATALEGPQ